MTSPSKNTDRIAWNAILVLCGIVGIGIATRVIGGGVGDFMAFLATGFILLFGAVFLKTMFD